MVESNQSFSTAANTQNATYFTTQKQSNLQSDENSSGPEDLNYFKNQNKKGKPALNVRRTDTLDEIATED